VRNLLGNGLAWSGPASIATRWPVQHPQLGEHHRRSGATNDLGAARCRHDRGGRERAGHRCSGEGCCSGEGWDRAAGTSAMPGQPWPVDLSRRLNDLGRGSLHRAKDRLHRANRGPASPGAQLLGLVAATMPSIARGALERWSRRPAMVTTPRRSSSSPPSVGTKRLLLRVPPLKRAGPTARSSRTARCPDVSELLGGVVPGVPPGDADGKIARADPKQAVGRFGGRSC
jgi:hypothetical protein